MAGITENGRSPRSPLLRPAGGYWTRGQPIRVTDHVEHQP